jgi:hypothetical protein
MFFKKTNIKVWRGVVVDVKKTILLVIITLSALVAGSVYAQGATYFDTSTLLPLDPSVTNTPIDAIGIDPITGDFVDENGYKIVTEDDISEFDHQSDSFVKDWREASPVDEYEDTEFGEFIYNEASTPTKLEILRLLSKDTPSMMVFMTAVSMGVDIENVLQASVNYQPNKGRDLAASAVNILPLLTESATYVYSGYELEDLERDDENQPYSVAKVVENFFENRRVLRPYPDWFEGQYHFMASAKELQVLQKPQKNTRWFRTKSNQDVTKRPIFVSLYESTNSVLIDSEERIAKALQKDPNAQLPVVFIFNRLNERPIDQVGYPLTIKGLQSAYAEKQIMLTPTPEWQLGEYHIYSKLEEFYEVFDIPEEEDFEPEAWQKLIEEAENYSVTNTAFLFVILGGADQENQEQTAKLAITDNQLMAAWDDPRSESRFPYVMSEAGKPVTLNNIMNKGLIFNRPDLIAALNALGVQRVPVAFYYLDSARVKPYLKGPKALIQAAIGITNPNGPFGGGGGITPPPLEPPICASPPCTEQ